MTLLVDCEYAKSMEDFYGELGRRIRAARKRLSGGGLTQEQLAQRVGLSRSSIANIERGEQQPPVHVFARIAEALDVRPENLLPKLDASVQEEVVRALQRRNLPPEEVKRVANLLLSRENQE